MNREAVPVSGTGHALVDLAGVARVGEIAAKGLRNYVYDDDKSIKFPSEEYFKREIVCAPKSSETTEDTATPKTIGSLKKDHWTLTRRTSNSSGIVYEKERSTFSRSLQEVPDSVNAVRSQV